MKKILKALSLMLVIGLISAVCCSCQKNNNDTVSDKRPSSAGNSSVTGSTVSAEQNSNGTVGNASEGGLTSGSGETPSGSSSGNTSGSSNTVSTVLGSETVKPTAGLKAVKQGDEITVTFSINENTGIAGFRFDFTYDKSVLTPKSFNKILPLDITSNIMQSGAAPSGKVTAVYASALGFDNTGDVFSVTFTMKDSDTKSTDFKLNLTDSSFVNTNMQYIEYTAQNTSINLK